MSFLGFSRVDFPFAGSATQFLSANYPGTAFIDNSTLIPPALASYDEVRNIGGALWFVINATWNPQTLAWLQVDPSKPSEATVYNTTGGLSFFTAAALGGVATNQPITFLPAGQVVPTTQYYSDRNKIINGDMRIDQRNNGAAITPTASTYVVDRWKVLITQSSKLQFGQNDTGVGGPNGFPNDIGILTIAPFTPGASDFFALIQLIEGNNVSDLAFGTTSAQPVTLSFWARANNTGTYGGSLQNSAGTRSYPFTYAITLPTTYQFFSITIPGDTTGTWVTSGTTAAIELNFGLGAGTSFSGPASAWASANYVTATGAFSVVSGSNNLFITGVQLESGAVATPFERRSFGTELALCQRYCYAENSLLNNVGMFGGTGFFFSSGTRLAIPFKFPVTMRAVPTFTSTAATTFTTFFDVAVSALALDSATTVSSGMVDFTTTGGTNLFADSVLANTTTAAQITFSAEL